MTEVMPKSASAQPMKPDNPCGARCRDGSYYNRGSSEQRLPRLFRFLMSLLQLLKHHKSPIRPDIEPVFAQTVGAELVPTPA